MCSARECANRCTGNVHIAAVWMMGNNGCVTVYLVESCGCYDVMRTSKTCALEIDSKAQFFRALPAAH